MKAKSSFRPALALIIGMLGAGLSQDLQAQGTDRASAGGATNAARPLDPFFARHFAAMFQVGPDAEANYQRSLRAIRANPRTPAMLLARYKALGQANPLERWQIVETLRELAAPVTLPFVGGIAASPVRHERGVEESGRDEIELMIRATAADAVAAIARKRNPAAERVLLGLLRSPEIIVRRRAVRGYLELGGDVPARVRRLKALLRPSDHDLIVTAPTDVRQVEAPQVSLKITRKNDGKRSPPPRADQPR